MTVKRYEGKSKDVLMPIINEELGPDATIISVKEKPPSGMFSFLKKPTIIITAACENEADLRALKETSESPAPAGKPAAKLSRRARKPASLPPDKSDGGNGNGGNNGKSGHPGIEETMNLLLQEARKAAGQINQMEADSQTGAAGDSKKTKPPAAKTVHSDSPSDSDKRDGILQTFYDTLASQDVLPEVASDILGRFDKGGDKANVKHLVASVYESVVDILKEPVLIDTEGDSPQIVVFMGATGVGKTTTIAKLSSLLALDHDRKVGLVTADTYRIAAVDQLKIYAEILGLDLRVVYTPDEMEAQLADMSAKYDVVLVDTAGRSHRDAEKMEELKSFLAKMPPDSKHYLVLSITTKYADLRSMVAAYGEYVDFSLIFTKLDETPSLGSLINICSLTGKKASYVTFGQSVPDDFEVIKPEKIAKSLLELDGGGYNVYSSGGNEA